MARAPALQAGGQGFDPPTVHYEKQENAGSTRDQKLKEISGQIGTRHDRRLRKYSDGFNEKFIFFLKSYRIENLRFLCPNCHSQTETFSGKNNKKPKKINNKKERPRKVERPPYQELLENISNLGYCGTGRKYGVSELLT